MLEESKPVEFKSDVVNYGSSARHIEIGEPEAASKPVPGFFSLSVRPWGLVLAVGAAATAATLLAFLGRFAWYFDLCSHFRVQYLIVLTGCVMALGLARRGKAAAAFLAMAAINLWFIAPLYVGGSVSATASTFRLRAMLLNVNTKLGDPERVAQLVQDVAPDILVLEEVSAGWLTELASLEQSHPHRVTWPREDNFGIALFSKQPLLGSDVVFIGSGEVPTIVATIDTPVRPLRVIATHPLPPVNAEYARARDEQLAGLAEHTRPHSPLLLLGDLNATPWSHHFRKLLAQSGLRDSSRGFGVQPTWPDNVVPLRIPIDHCLHSTDITIFDRWIGADVGSDHFPLIVDFAMSGTTK